MVHGMKHLLPITSLPTVLTVHDMMPMTSPGQFGIVKRTLLASQYLRSIREANALVPNSQATARLLASIEPEAIPRIRVAPLGVASTLAEAIPRRPAAILDGPFALVVGDLSPRKNLRLLLDIWSEVHARSDGLRLVVVGPEGWRSRKVRRRLERLSASNEVVWARYLTDGELRWGYENARMVLIPSLEEGFGLPVVEAMTLGSPVIASTDPALVEAGTGIPEHVSATDPGAWIDAILRTLERSEPVPHFDPPSWDACRGGNRRGLPIRGPSRTPTVERVMSETAVELSVIVATRNRAGLLDGCLSHLAVQDLDRRRYEVIVVDNGSHDATPTVVERWKLRSSVFRSVHEPNVGLSNARNAGIAAAKGEIVAFVDDDAGPYPDWSSAVLRSYQSEPDVAAVGGPVELVFETGRPAWLTPALETWFSGVDLGEARLVQPGPVLAGSNMSIRADWLAALGGFSPRLGRTANSLLSNDETDLLERLADGGGLVVYEPTARVRHFVQPDRLSLRWLLARTLAQGRSDVIQDRQHDVARRQAGRDGSAALRRGLGTGWRADVTRRRHGEPGPTVWVESLARRSSDLSYAFWSLSVVFARASGRSSPTIPG